MLDCARVIARLGLLLAVAAAGVAPAAAAPGDAIIIIANKTYRSGVAPVEFADRDGDAVEKAAREVLGVDRFGVKRFNDMTVGEGAGWFHADGGPGEDLAAFVRRASQGRRDATVYFYYSGHGITARNSVREKDELHLVLHDTRTDDVSRQGLSIEAIKSALAQIQQQVLPNGRVVMLIDACFSGFGRDGKEIYKGARAGAVAATLAPLPKVVVLAAAGPAESAWSDLNRRHGAFTDAVLDGLYGGAADDKGQITAERLLSFVGRRVAGRLSRQPGGARYQTPMLAGDSSMLIAALRTPLRLERDPGKREALELRCTVVAASADMTDMREFLKSECDDDCPCRASIEEAIAERESSERRCKLEADQLATLRARGAAALPGIKALAGVVRCPAVKAQVAAAIGELDLVAREERQREMERRAKEEAERATRAAARKALEDEFARQLAAARKQAEEEQAAAERRKAQEDADRKARETAARERKAQEEAALKAKEDADRKTREAAAREARLREEAAARAREAAARDPANQVTPGSGYSFRDRLANGQPCTTCPELVLVPAGSFMMGSPPGEKDRESDEGPQRTVTFARPFAVGRFEVTFEEWDACVTGGGCNAYHPRDQGWGRARRPVINVGWQDAKAYVSWLSKTTSRSYRLLTEAEWEYAARSGMTTPYSTGQGITTDEANFDGRQTPAGTSEGLFRERTLVVGTFRPNAWGINDVHGNVWEWVEDCWNDNYSGAAQDGSARTTGQCNYRVVRGGSWGSTPRLARSASRNGDAIENRSSNLGFRVARTIGP